MKGIVLTVVINYIRLMRSFLDSLCIFENTYRPKKLLSCFLRRQILKNFIRFFLTDIFQIMKLEWYKHLEELYT